VRDRSANKVRDRERAMEHLTAPILRDLQREESGSVHTARRRSVSDMSSWHLVARQA
jgi:hypothetical protein